MIRKFRDTDMEPILDIWLQASVRAHGFVEPGFWKSQIPAMRETYLPASDVYVFEADGVVIGFLALHGDTLAALFVAPREQGRGVGTRLLDHAKALRERLELSVYKANAAAAGFYRANGFRFVCERPDEHTGHPELVLCWVGN